MPAAKEKKYQGFDRGIDYLPIKQKLLDEFNKQYKIYSKGKNTKRASRSLIFLLIELIQLRNGSRITEAINAFKLFAEKGIEQRVTVKICKSEAKKKVWKLNEEKNIKEKKEVTTKLRTRDIMFPKTWFNDLDINELINKLKESHEELINDDKLKVTICKYMIHNFDCNTHSLRYAFINYMLYKEKRPMTDVAKFVGHKNINQLVTYTQQKNCDQIFDLDI